MNFSFTTASEPSAITALSEADRPSASGGEIATT